ncbi:MAG: LuxR family transcriptional regulator [Pseudomonadota bacterium]|jgi:two-component system NarL family response regulator
MSFGTEQFNSPVKLYLVDDHLVLRQALAEALGHRGKYAVVGHTGSCNELLNQSPHCKADVIVLDFSLPKTNGLEILNELRRRGIDIPVLFLSGDESGRAAKAALQAGAKGFVSKQGGLSEMEHAIDEIVRGGTYLSPSIASNSNGAPGQEAWPSSSVLSNREREIMVLLANGKPNREIGKLLSISVRTVDTHRSNILKKLGFKTNAELVKLAIAEGWVTT